MKTTDKVPEMPLADKDISNFSEDMLYPPSQDIYNHSKKADDIDPDDVTEIKPENAAATGENEMDFEEDISGDDLDVPGSEIDDEQEAIGNEDEENNFYSLGGDNHNNLEEDQGE